MVTAESDLERGESDPGVPSPGMDIIVTTSARWGWGGGGGGGGGWFRRL